MACCLIIAFNIHPSNISDDNNEIEQTKMIYIFHDYEGNEADIFETLAKSGINTIRVRVWNDPYDADGNSYGGGNCDIDTAVEIG